MVSESINIKVYLVSLNSLQSKALGNHKTGEPNQNQYPKPVKVFLDRVLTKMTAVTIKETAMLLGTCWLSWIIYFLVQVFDILRSITENQNFLMHLVKNGILMLLWSILYFARIADVNILIVLISAHKSSE